MPQFKPFRGIRPNKDLAGKFATKSVDAYSKESLEKEITENPDSFLHLIQPTWTRERILVAERHQRVKKNFLEFVQSDKVEKDKESYYIYQVQKPNNESVRALIGLVNMMEYKEGKIKKHEKTLTKRVKRFADYLLDVHFHAEPVLLTYQHNQRVDLLMEHEMKKMPLVSFQDENEVQHQLWLIDNRLNIQQIKDSIEKNEFFYIADGHHRMESSLAYTEQMQDLAKNAEDAEITQFTMAMLVSDRELIIRDYNRLIKDLNGLSPAEFLEKLNEKFEINERGENAFFPSKKHHLGLYMEGKFYSMLVKRENLTVEGLSELDTYLFEEIVLKPILNIQDSRNDNRLGFIRGTGNIDGVKNLQAQVDSGEYIAGFFFYPVVSVDLEKIADLGLTMPPKSTYIEPKPLTGLTIFQLLEP